mgnify:CR=1 FL=1
MFKKFQKRHSKKLLAFLTAAVLLAGCCGCGAGTQTKSQTDETLPAATESLVLYAGPYMTEYLNRAVNSFKQQYPDVDVQVRDFGDYSDPQNETTYLETLKSDLSAGAGPDLILFMTGGQADNEFDDMEKTMQSGIFQDLNGYLAGDTEYTSEDYNTAVLNAGVYNENQFYIPLGYKVETLVTTEEMLASVKQTLPETADAFNQCMCSFGQTYRDDTGKYFSAHPNMFFNLFWSSGISILDYDSKTVSADGDELGALLDAYKELYEIDCGRSEKELYVKDPNMYSTLQDAQLLEEGKILQILESEPQRFMDEYSLLSYQYVPEFTAIPSVQGKPAAEVSMGAAINKNADNKANAYRMLRVMMGEEMQEYGCDLGNLPVLNGTLEKYMLLNNIGRDQEATENSPGSKTLPQDVIDKYVALMTDVTCANVSSTVEGFVWDEMEPYFTGQKSYDDCLASLKNKLELYVNE